MSLTNKLIYKYIDKEGEIGGDTQVKVKRKQLLTAFLTGRGGAHWALKQREVILYS